MRTLDSDEERDHERPTGSHARSSVVSGPEGDGRSTSVAETISDVFRSVRLTGAVFFDVQAGAPWVASAPSAREIAPLVMPGADHVFEFHAVLEGECWGGLLDQPRMRLEAGDVIVFPLGNPHVLSSSSDLRSEPDYAKYRHREPTPRPFSLRSGSDAADARILCGFLGCDARPFNPLLGTLPRVFHLSSRSAPSPLLKAFLTLAVDESVKDRIGRESVLGKLSELMFIEAVRLHVEAMAPGERGWLVGLRDEFVGRAISLLHARPADDWTLEDLARGVGLSRSALAERFAQYVGQPPIQYLTHWRMQLAGRMLREGTSTMASIAEEVGYASEAAFSRAFKKVVGTSPATWRRQSVHAAGRGSPGAASLLDVASRPKT